MKRKSLSLLSERYIRVTKKSERGIVTPNDIMSLGSDHQLRKKDKPDIIYLLMEIYIPPVKYSCQE